MTGPAPVPFGTSRRSSIGLEWEIGLVDVGSGAMAQVAPQVIEDLSPEGADPRVKAELMRNTVEIATGVCDDVGAVGAELDELLDRVAISAGRHGAAVIGGAMHPLARWEDQLVTDKERYARLVDRIQVFVRQLVTWGLHVHVGVEHRDKVLALVQGVVTYAPHLQALSASSPYWGGVDTGYASTRAMLFQQIPTAGLPHPFTQWHEVESYAQDMRRVGVAQEFNEIHWDVRPSPAYGTIEVRICDGPTNVTEAMALGALTHCLVEHLSTELDHGRELPVLPPWFAKENKWRAARYGMDATIITSADGDQLPVSDAIAKVLVELEPTAERLGCAEHLAAVADIARTGSSYQRQRAVADASGGDLDAVVRAMLAEMETGRPLPHFPNRT
ncbi:glutamate--cysteine ligase [Myceligenerans salitolerans]|uniref:Putative glutamate--cysteine ligase 2 n=1 Tax=Myceligenerans salitolerans TaxID=1230528 RepID=A0ABS3I6K1_9MICO|nr:glutamate--cysteine ligase [Myceligenerans salitolerans]MBO0608635.1 glutamate--cysteine ligase [Myceligenerans salitolerans]